MAEYLFFWVLMALAVAGACGCLAWALCIFRTEYRTTSRASERERCIRICEDMMKDDMPGAVLGRTVRIIKAIQGVQ